ncbi:hypothetical protein NE237_024888 [Protea cynaroides]|uniref:Uncharacterized protein n=1 Tax=Protea cynaroides TaxID=273540 RepID=A0A9Q0H532_9MAGN|nr:hypothetical protein NE237_024888 [Protea cynaroides]
MTKRFGLVRLWRGMVHCMSQTTGLVVHMMVGGFWMRDSLGTKSIQGAPFIGTFLRGIIVHLRHLLLVLGLNQEEVLMKNMPFFQEVDKFWDGYHGIDSYRDVATDRDYGFDKPARFGGRDHDEFAADDYDYIYPISHFPPEQGG